MSSLTPEEVTRSTNTPSGVLRLVVVQPTPFCNINCSYCYLPGRQVRRVMAPEVLEAIYRRLAISQLPAPELVIAWHAGEPLTAGRAFYELAFRLAGQMPPSCRLIQTVQTNAMLIDQQWCDLFRAQNVHLGVSLDGPAFLHDSHRRTRSGVGTHAQVMRGITLLQENQVPFGVITVLTRDHLDRVDELFDFYVANGIRRVGFNIEEIEGVNTWSSLQGEGIEERYGAFLRRFYQRVADSEPRMQVREFDSLGSFIGDPRGKIERSSQTIPLSILNIDWAGNFTTFSPELLAMKSADYGDFILGNVLRDSFESVLESEKFQRIHEDIEAGVEACRQDCPYFSVCGGGTPANKYWENGTFRSTETMYCRLTKQVLTDIVFDELEARLGLGERETSC